MGDGAAAGRRGLDLAPGVFLDPGALFLTEGDESWSGSRICALAGRIAATVESLPGPTIGVCSPSAAFVAAATLALWKARREPLILDPNLKGEADHLLRLRPDLPVLAEAQTPFLSANVQLPASSGRPLEPCWPEDHQELATFFTSGSTGEPKLVTKRAHQLLCQLEEEPGALGFPERPSCFSLVPPFHILGFMYGFLTPLVLGGSTAFLAGTAPDVWIRHIRRARPDIVVGVPSHYRFIVKTLEEELPPAIYMSSGSPLPADVDEAFAERAGCRLLQVYGSTETGGVATRSGSGAWRPLPGLQWQVDAADGRLMVFSPWQEGPERWRLTDDLAVADGQGFRLIGRADSIVKVGGKRFSSNEVVDLAQSLPAVEQGVAVVYERYGEGALALFVTMRSGGGPSESELRRLLHERLAPFKVPRTVRVLESLPLLANGKVDRQALRRLAESDSC